MVLAEGKNRGVLRVTGEVLAEAGSAKAKLYGIAAAHDLTPSFPPEVMAEVRAWEAHPGIDDPALEDWTDRPFITIDNEDSRDLDQAMHIRRTPSGGYEVAYALADASYYVRPGSALHAEASRRGVTYYFPGFAVPMLPSELSEGLVSLNEGVDRRAFAVVTELDAQGEVIGSKMERVRMRSQAKLSYDGVQAHHDGQDVGMGGRAYSETLDLLREVGEKRMALAEARGVVRIRRDEVRTSLDPEDPTGFVVSARNRNGVERWNEQISLLCNEEGAKFMETEGNAPWVTPIYRIHPRPISARVKDFALLVDGVVEAHGLDRAVWGWDQRGGESLADYLAKLPEDGPHATVAQALHRQAIMLNRASEFSDEPGKHHGIGAEPYARFSSPMREMVGIYTHKEALEKLSGEPPPGWVRANEASRAEMVSLANETKSRQKKIAKQADKLVLDHLLGQDLERPVAERPVRQASILGLSAKKVYVRFDDPPFEVKLYVPDLEIAAASGGPLPKLKLDESGAQLVSNDERLPTLKLGDRVAVRLTGVGAHEKYRFELVR